jgi:hypothetical protein
LSKNHLPTDYGIWVPFTGFRFKDLYDIQLHDGSIIKSCRPNADVWTSWTDQTQHPRTEFHDSEVAMVRLIPDDEVVEEYHFSGEYRIKRNSEMFGFPYEESL